MAKDYSEDQLIQKSTAEFMEKELGWKSIFAFDQEKLGTNGTLGRITYHEVLLTRHLRQALKRFNPWLTEKQLQECLDSMTEHMSSQTLMQINESKYKMIREIVLRMPDDYPVLRCQRRELGLQPFSVQKRCEEKLLAIIHDTDFILVRHRGEYDVTPILLVRRTLEEVAVGSGLDIAEKIGVHTVL